MNDVLDAGLPGVIEQGLALSEHVYGVAGEDKEGVDAFEGGQVGALVIEVKGDGGNAAGGEGCGFLGGAGGGDDLDCWIVQEEVNGAAANLAGGSGNEDLTVQVALLGAG